MVDRVTVHLTALACSARAPEVLARFWGAMLGREVMAEPVGLLLPGSETQVGLRFVADPAPRAAVDRVHLHLTSTTPDDQQQIVARARDLGATPLDVGQRAEEGHIVLADPEGNAFCVIEAGNAFLAGTGLLGELACDGTRDVGRFWAAALTWPLVWDQHEETAIQAPAGGTKIAWGGPPVAPLATSPRERFELAVGADEADGEIARLLALGATRHTDRADGTAFMTDPDGNEFLVARSVT